ncbi:AMP-binding protein [Lonsdalea quercina]|uniref:AMP-binding protein n=1 Tax=Lonsdalea quercina TaxID=71657 RepID=UPI00047B576A|nr:AMP-binding protein [Lonsdalea quercina]
MFTSMMRMIGQQLLSNRGIAIVNAQGSWRYDDIASRVGAICGELARIQPKSALIYGHKERDTAAALLACAWSGIPFTVVDSVNPPLRMARIAALYAAELILDGRERPETAPIDQESFPSLWLPALPDGDFVGGYTAPSCVNPLFYVLSTSGSTGQPKGVQIGCDNFGAFFGWYHRVLREAGAEEEGHLNHARLSFDMGLLDFFTGFALGRPLIMLPHEYNALPRLNLNMMLSEPTVSLSSGFSTPSFLEIMCKDPRFNAETLPHFRTVMVGGEYVSPNLIDRLLARFPSLKILHAYGPTETTCLTHLHPVDGTTAQETGLLPLGQPCGTLRVAIEDGHHNALPEGDIGEVVIYGDQVGLGYLPESHPNHVAFGSRHGVPFYRTGDLGWQDARGHLFIKGRLDSQVKWHGNRVDLQEIDAVACSFAHTVMATTLPVYQAHKLDDVLLFVQLHPHVENGEHELRVHLSHHLPHYMVPTSIRFISEFPLNQNGKIDRQALLHRVAAALKAHQHTRSLQAG